MLWVDETFSHILGYSDRSCDSDSTFQYINQRGAFGSGLLSRGGTSSEDYSTATCGHIALYEPVTNLQHADVT